MLVCNVSLLHRRAAIAAGLVETAAALDAPGTGNVVFATLVDDPASVGERVDAFLGQIMLEAASAAATVSAGLVYARAEVEAAVATDIVSAGVAYAVAVAEAVTAADVVSASVVAALVATISEAAAAASAQDATVTAAAVTTWDPVTVAAVTLSGGNLVATNTGTTGTNQGAHVDAAMGKTSGKFYFEITITAKVGGGNVGIGVGTPTSTYTTMGQNGVTGNMVFSGSGNIYTNGSSSGSSLSARSTGDVIGFAVDLDNRKFWCRVAPAGNWNGSGTANPATNVGGVVIPSGTMVPFCAFGGSGGVANNIFTANFGASTFTGAVPSGFTSGWPP